MEVALAHSERWYYFEDSTISIYQACQKARFVGIRSARFKCGFKNIVIFCFNSKEETPCDDEKELIDLIDGLVKKHGHDVSVS